MSPLNGSRIVSVHPGLEQSLQDALLSAIETVLEDAESERIWIEESPTHDLRVHAELPSVEAPEAPVVPIGSAPSAVTTRSSVSVDPAALGRSSTPGSPEGESVE